MKKATISLGTKNILQSIIIGVFWLIAGILNILGTKIALIISATALLVAAIVNFSLSFFNEESGDEMSEFNTYKAKACAFDITLSGVMLFCIYSAIKMISGTESTINWNGWLLIYIGIIQVVKGILFKIYEKGIDL